MCVYRVNRVILGILCASILFLNTSDMLPQCRPTSESTFAGGSCPGGSVPLAPQSCAKSWTREYVVTWPDDHSVQVQTSAIGHDSHEIWCCSLGTTLVQANPVWTEPVTSESGLWRVSALDAWISWGIKDCSFFFCENQLKAELFFGDAEEWTASHSCHEPECSTDADCPGGYACLDGECVQQPPDPDPCLNGFQQTTTWILPSGGEPLRAQQQQQFTLRRFANRPEGAVFVEEWVIVRNQPQVVSEVRNSSTEEFASSIANFTSMLSHAGLPDGDVLIVQAATHPHNARHVPPPKFVPLNASLTSGWENLIGTYWFRAEISESRKVDHLSVFGTDSDRGLSDLQAVLQRELRVEFADHSRHRTVVFGFGRATESGRLVVDSALTLVPACCCPECMPPVDPGES
jgi:hypothetical protein